MSKYYNDVLLHKLIYVTIGRDDVIYGITCLQKSPKGHTLVYDNKPQNVHWSMTRNHKIWYCEIPGEQFLRH